jgi:hypothetical protein
MAWDKQRYVFFLYFLPTCILTSICLKVLCLREEMSAAAGKGWDKRGARDATHLEPQVCFYYYLLLLY